MSVHAYVVGKGDVELGNWRSFNTGMNALKDAMPAAALTSDAYDVLWGVLGYVFLEPDVTAEEWDTARTQARAFLKAFGTELPAEAVDLLSAVAVGVPKPTDDESDFTLTPEARDAGPHGQ